MSVAAAAGARTLATTCCVVGGGPAGMMLGYLLARAGVDVTVLEKHADFLRDFRGDTIHPSTLQVMHELGLLEALLKRPHNEATHLTVQVGDTPLTIADFSWLPRERAFIALMPQWDFLDFLAERSPALSGLPSADEGEVTDLIEESGRVVGVHVDARRMVRSTCARASSSAATAAIRRCAPKPASRSRTSARPSTCCGCASRACRAIPGLGGRIDAGSFFAVLDRGDYFQCAYVIRKGAARARDAGGIARFPADGRQGAPLRRATAWTSSRAGTTSSC